VRIAELFKKDILDVAYVIGTGPSLRCLPLDFFRGRGTTIGINQAWKHLQTDYVLTVHPELYLEYARAEKKPTVQWIIKKKKPMFALELDDPTHYVFHTSYDREDAVKRPEDTLYLGEGAQTTAIDLAARMGAKFVVLAGCDMTNVGGDFHAHDQHVKWLGVKPKDQYAYYRKSTAKLRRRLREAFGVHVMTLSPFVGVGHADEDYGRYRAELGLATLPPPKDDSGYKRKDPPRI
jgi:hypothetical protein